MIIYHQIKTLVYKYWYIIVVYSSKNWKEMITSVGDRLYKTNIFDLWSLKIINSRCVI